MRTERPLIFVFLLIFLFAVASCSGPRAVTRRSELPMPPQASSSAERVPPPAVIAQPNAKGEPALPAEAKPSESISTEVPAPTAPAPATPPPGAAPSTPIPPIPLTPAKPLVPPAAPQPKPKPAQGIVFKFDNADLYEVIRTFAEVLKINYVIDPRVKGTVNIHTSGAISNDDIYPIFLSILRMNGATIVKKDSIYEIVPFSEGKRLSVSTDERKRSTEDQFVIEIIKPNFIPIAELEKVIKPFLSDEKEVISFPQNNMLIIADLASNVRKLRDIVSLLDIDIFSSMAIRIYPVFNSDVNDMAKDLGAIFAAFGISSKEARGGGVTFTPIVRSNSLLVVSSMPGILEKVENWIHELDKAPAEESKVWVHVYYVQNAKAKDLAEVLKQVYVKTKETTTRPTQPSPTPTPAPTPPPRTPTTKPTPAPTPAPTPSAREEAARPAEGELNIVVDEQNNALVIRALYRDYKAVLETIQKLDIYPKQVVIDVLLAEITLDESTQYGIQWGRFISSNNPTNAQEFTFIKSPPALDKIFDVTANAFSGGFRYSIVELGGRVAAAISAAATDNRLKVLASPHVIASNNKEAKIQIGQEQPILTSTYTSTATTSSDVVTGTIEYKDIGVILTLTPRISDGGLVTLEIQIEDSTAAQAQIGSSSNLLTVPVFAKKTAKTTVSVMEGQTIIIGGLMRDQKTVNKTGIPFLSKIPILGALFGYHEYIDANRETIVLMTPRIITNQIQSRTVTDEFEQRLREIRKEIEEREKKKK